MSNNMERDAYLFGRIKRLEDLGWSIQWNGRDAVTVSPPEEIKKAVGYIDDVRICAMSSFDSAASFAEGFAEGYKVRTRAKK